MPDIVGAVLTASAVAAGVLAVSRGGDWGRLSHRPQGRVRAYAVLPLISWRRRARDPRRFRGSPGAATKAAAPPAMPVVRRVGLGRVVHGGASGLDGTIGTTAKPGGPIAVTGATVPIGRPPLRGPVPGHARVLMAVLPATVLLAATALVRVAGASERQNGPRSRRAAEEGPAMPRRLLAEPRARLDRAGTRPARPGDPPRVTHPL
ncbi:hypothetical protein [Nonomuraea sp. NPDC050202]|uniref:hypothetical protein n=1 Tax=Nonomuraea sp. NPDC050202 TaxID=3155035 RepID=UPI0033EBD381